MTPFSVSMTSKENPLYCAKRSNFELVRQVNVVALISKLAQAPHLYKAITARQDAPGSPHHDTECIFLRWPADQSVHAAFNDLTSIPYPAVAELPEAMAIADKVLTAVDSFEIGRVIIAKLKPGGFIDEHFDDGAYADKFDRFHVVLASEPGNEFFSRQSNNSGEFVEMQVGEVWWFNHKAPHWVINSSNHDRVHLIVDCVAPAYRSKRV